MKAVWIALLASGVLAAPAWADDDAERAEKADRGRYNQLVSQLRRAHGELATLQAQAVAHARRGEDVPNPLKAQILNLRDEIDRKSNRLTMVALRYGWEVPDFSSPPGGESGPPATSPKAEIFAPVDAMVRRSLQAEAEAIAAEVRLPVVSLAMEY